MNIFYAPPDQILENRLKLSGREARHAAKVLRYRRGDKITVVDGMGGWYEGKISQIGDQKVEVHIISSQQRPPVSPNTAVAMGIIKKRDRLEFAVEKAVELGAAEIAIFRGDHSVKQNVRLDRLKSTAISAMKQSLQAWLPGVRAFSTLNGLMEHYSGYTIRAAHKSGKKFLAGKPTSDGDDFLLVTGPEGDFSSEELQLLQKQKTKFISLGKRRLRAETAAITFLNSFLLLHNKSS